MSCDVCVDPYTKTKRKKVTCNHCENSCCLECFKKYLLTSEYITPKCMFCNHEISYSFIREVCSYSFCNKELHEKRADTEMKRQMSLLPTTQNLAILELEKRKYFKEMELYDDRIAELRREIALIERQKSTVVYPTSLNILERENKITFIQKCPIENCGGFLNSNWKCSICETYICSKCLVPKKSRIDEEHVCDEDMVKSVTSIRKDSKPCPNCATYIFKIDGCDQMWCPECKTAFSWKTGEIETGSVHNPHYFDYLRSTTDGEIPRQDGDVRPCDAIPTANDFWGAIRTWRVRGDERSRDEISRKIYNLIRHRVHIRRVQMRKLITNYQDEFTNLRVGFILKDIDENYFRSQVKKLIKKEEKNTEITQIYTLYTTVTAEILRNLLELLTRGSVIDDLEKEINKVNNLAKYCNENLFCIREKFKCKIELICNFF